jgi:hypothetical protein
MDGEIFSIDVSNTTIVRVQALLIHLQNTDWTIVQTIVNNRINNSKTEHPYATFVFVINHENYKGNGFREVIVIVDQFGFLNSSGDFS